MSKLKMNVGGYYCFGKNPGMPFKVIETTEEGYQILWWLDFKLNMRKKWFNDNIENNQIKKISEEEAKGLSMVWLL